jgi:16S rRNA (cytosine967-C5)-methyltransferase
VALHRLDSRADTAHTIVDQAVTAAATLLGGKFKGVVNGVLRNALRQSADLNRAADADMVAEFAIRPGGSGDCVYRMTGAPPDGRIPIRRWPCASMRRAAVSDVLSAFAAADLPVRELANGALLLDRPVPVAGCRVSPKAWSASGCGRPAPPVTLIWPTASGFSTLAPRPAARLPTSWRAPMWVGGPRRRCLPGASGQRKPGASWPFRPGQRRRLPQGVPVVGRAPFQRILADVPCSASGVVRRNPDIKWLRRSDDVARFAAQQAEILDALWQVLAPGGKMLYVTCSVFAEENREQIAAFAARHPDCCCLPIGGQPDCQYLPSTEHDGFFYALLEKAV